MPPNLTIAAFIFGAALILIGLTGGSFELFGIKILGRVGAFPRLISSLLGVGFVILGILIAVQPNPTPGNPPAGPGGPITVTVNAIPLTVNANQWSEIHVIATNSSGQPIPDATVNVQAGGGLFDGTNNVRVVGPTDPGGTFVTRWRCNGPCAPAYSLDVKVTKPNFGDGNGQISIHVK